MSTGEQILLALITVAAISFIAGVVVILVLRG